MKIHWLSNAPASPTGYGNQTATFIWRLRKLGHETSMTAFYGLQGAPVLLNDLYMMPSGADAYANDVIIADVNFTKSDILISLMDVWVLKPELMELARWYPWVPIDSMPSPDKINEVLQVARRPIAMSQFGVKMLQEAGFNPLYVPHGVDTTIYKPESQAEARKALDMPEKAFIVGMFMANKGAPSRKAFSQQIRAFAEFQARHPEAVLYLHTDMKGLNQGENLFKILELAGLEGSDNVLTVPPYPYARGLIGAEEMRVRYSACDVVMNASMGEGFGIPIIEAQACGVPVVVTDFSSMPELVFSGWVAEYAEKLFTGLETYQVIPSTSSIAEKLEEAWQAKQESDWQDFRDQARKGIVENYDADVVLQKYWKPVLEEIEAEIHAITPEYIAMYDAIAQRDAGMGRGEADSLYNQHRRDLAVEMLKPYVVDGAKVVDLGCAEGDLLAALPSARKTGVDISPERVKAASKKHPNIVFIASPGEQYGAPGEYNVVICSEVIEHVPDPAKLLANIKRLLAENGVALITTPNDPLALTLDNKEHVRVYSWATFNEELEKAGFDVITIRSTVPDLYGGAGWLARDDAEGLAAALAGTWEVDRGSNLYALVRKDSIEAARERRRARRLALRENGKKEGEEDVIGSEVQDAGMELPLGVGAAG